MINLILDSNSQAMKATRNQMKSIGISGIIIGIAFMVFAWFAYNEMPDSFMAYFLGATGIITLISSALRLSKKQAYPNLEKDRK